MNHHQNLLSRREFLGRATVAGVGLVAASKLTAAPAVRTATDQVALGRSGVTVSRLAMGTGSNGGSVQRQLGQEAFTRLIREGLDRGLTFIESAENYRGLHTMLREALTGVDRQSIQLMTKIPWGRHTDALPALDQYRREVGTDYFDICLIHCVTRGDWVEQLKPLRESLELAKERGLIRAHGVSAHGLDPLEASAATAWGDVRLARVNHNGTKMDSRAGGWNDVGDVAAVLPQLQRMHAAGKGIIGMKLIGNGDFRDPAVRRESIHFVMGLDYVDAVTIGFKSPAEIDEAIANINTGLNR